MSGYDLWPPIPAVGLLAHCVGVLPGVSWFKQRVTLDLLDKAAYALATGLIFAALWPGG
jgi:hypothetical protein